VNSGRVQLAILLPCEVMNARVGQPQVRVSASGVRMLLPNPARLSHAGVGNQPSSHLSYSQADETTTATCSIWFDILTLRGCCVRFIGGPEPRNNERGTLASRWSP